MDLIQGVREAKVRAVARAISLIEDGRVERERIVDELFPFTGRAMILGVTGPPGSGKSTLVNRLIARQRRRGRKVAVVAVDPTSPFTGGALLGDRLRMQEHACDPGVFIRSMASRGQLGGVAQATGDAVKVLDAAGYEVILIETIGVGQTEVDVVRLADLVLLVLMPGSGDEIQALKAGIMEIGDLFIINKKEMEGADKLKAEVEYALSLKEADGEEDPKPVLPVSARLDEGVDELEEAVEESWLRLKRASLLERRRKARLAQELKDTFARKVLELVGVHANLEDRLPAWVDGLYARSLAPYALVDGQIRSFMKEKAR